MMVGGVPWHHQVYRSIFVSVRLGRFKRHQWLGPSMAVIGPGTMVIGHGDVF